jgi:hypothetical protein
VLQKVCAKRKVLACLFFAFACFAAMHLFAASFSTLRATANAPTFVLGEVQGRAGKDYSDYHTEKGNGIGGEHNYFFRLFCQRHSS